VPDLKTETPYNPLDKKNLGISVADAMLSRPVTSLPPKEGFIAAGIYALDTDPAFGHISGSKTSC
jgi:hypothetical protein